MNTVVMNNISMNKYPILIPLFLVVLFISSIIPPNDAEDSITQNQTIKVGDTLVSESNAYVLGFFQRKSGRYLGIWFTFSNHTIIWVANRRNPIPDGASASLQFTGDGSLAIVENTDNVLWSSAQRGQGNTLIAKLLDSGNLIITNGDGDGLISWQSFDYPSDTLVAEMKLGFDKRSGRKWNLTNWKSQDDPSPGEFTIQMYEGQSHEIFTSKGKEIIFRVGIWNGIWLSGNPGSSSFYNIKYDYVDNQSMAFYSYQTSTQDMYSILKVFPNGSQVLYAWTRGTNCLYFNKI